MKKLFPLSLLLLSSLLLGSCQDCFKAEGPLRTEQRAAGTYTEVESALGGKLVLLQGPTPKIEITAPSNLLPIIETRVGDKRLTLVYTEDCVKNAEGLEVRVTLPNLTYAALSGSGNVTSETPFEVDNLKLQLSGSGNISMQTIEATGTVETVLSGSGNIQLSSGFADTFVSRISGSGNVDARNLQAQHANTNTSGSGNTYVWAEQTLDVAISGSGSVFYRGNASITNANISGSGNIQKLP